jgi:CRP/FNR family cyclic AMP-dependent transcriptional regulator
LKRQTPSHATASATPDLDVPSLVESVGLAKAAVHYERGDTVFIQGDACQDVMYVQTGCIELSVLSKAGREAVVGILGPGDFFGEGCLVGEPLRLESATAMTPSAILLVPKDSMAQLLRQHQAMFDRFMAHMLARNIRIEEDLIDQLLNSSEKRLARALLLLARFGQQDGPTRVLPKLSQEKLAKMVGTTRPRVNVFLNKFRRLGFVEYDG